MTSEGKREPHGYANEPRLFYPGRNLSESDRARVVDYRIEIDDLTVDHLVYSMSKQIEENFQTFYTVAEDVLGEEQALRVAEEIGRRYGGGGYAKWLVAHGYADGAGTPATMARYQDLVHALRGPKHTSALFAEYDDERCVVRRQQCIYYSEERPQNGKFTQAFERGCLDGYMSVDANLIDVQVVRCRFQGADDCEQHWIFDSDGAAAAEKKHDDATVSATRN